MTVRPAKQRHATFESLWACRRSLDRQSKFSLAYRIEHQARRLGPCGLDVEELKSSKGATVSGSTDLT